MGFFLHELFQCLFYIFPGDVDVSYIVLGIAVSASAIIIVVTAVRSIRRHCN